MDEPEPEHPQIDLRDVRPEDIARVISGWLTPSPPPDAEGDAKKKR